MKNCTANVNVIPHEALTRHHRENHDVANGFEIAQADARSDCVLVDLDINNRQSSATGKA